MTVSPELLLDGKVTLYSGDCLARLKELPDNSVDGCITDPPYHLASIVERFGRADAAPAKFGTDGAFARAARGFMGHKWDGGDIAFRPDVWREVFRVSKPGAPVFTFTASKQLGRQQLAIEAAGFEATRDVILDMIEADSRVVDFIASLNDAQRGAFFKIMEEGDDVGGLLAWTYGCAMPKSHRVAFDYEKRLCEKRGKEFHYLSDGVIMAREAPFRHPLANAWAGYGSALKPAFEPIIMTRKPLAGSIAENVEAWGCGALNIDAARIATNESTRRTGYAEIGYGGGNLPGAYQTGSDVGRWPANITHDGSDAVTRAFPDDAARLFHSAKAGDDDRAGSHHPTVKRLDLIQWLVRLGSAPGAVLLDPFAGTGTLGEATFREGRRAILIEAEPEYQADIRRRMALALAGPDERRRESIKAKTRDDTPPALPLFA